MIQLSKKEQIIFDKLGDEESKKIFEARIQYNSSKDDQYIDEIIRSYIIDTGINTRGVIRYLLWGFEDFHFELPLIVYGCGEMGKKIYHEIGDCIFAFCDRDKNKRDFCGKKVISIEELVTSKEQYAVLIGSIDYYEEIYQELSAYHVNFAINNRQIVNKWLQITGEQYFDKDIIKFDKDEVFVDGGCLNFGTGKELLKRCSTVKKIYAFEPDQYSYLRSQDEAEKLDYINYKIIPKGLYSKNTNLHFTMLGNGCSHVSESGENVVSVCSLDHEIDDDVTFIKMDIEGMELDALVGAKEIIKRCHPKLAICVYHKPEDIIMIPEYILKINPTYKLFLRHYSDNAGETVLYAIE